MYTSSFKGHKLDAIDALLHRYDSRLADFAEEYGEPGYSLDEDDGLLLFADWNPVPRPICEGLRRRGYRLHWLDEWIARHVSYGDVDARRAYRSAPNSYGWKQYFITEAGELIPGDKIENDPSTRDWYVEEYLRNEADRVNLFDIDLSAYGYEKYNGTYRNGMHRGHDDNPQEIFDAIRAEYGAHTDCINGGLNNRQFGVDFTVYYRKAEDRR